MIKTINGIKDQEWSRPINKAQWHGKKVINRMKEKKWKILPKMNDLTNFDGDRGLCEKLIYGKFNMN